MTISRSRYLQMLTAFIAALLLSTIAASSAMAKPDNQDDVVSPQATQVSVNVSCSADGSYAWNTTMTDGTPNSNYTIYYQWSHTYRDGDGNIGGGGSFGWERIGKMVLGSHGIGTSSTFYSSAYAGRTSVTIDVRINGVYGSDTDSC